MSERNGINKNLTSYGDTGFSRYMRRAFLASAGYDREDLDRPIIGIVNTSSDYNTCHQQMPQIIEAVKRGVMEAGGLPFAFPTISLHEILTSPTTMLYRNLAAMDTEAMVRCQPMDAVVLVGGCDKTVPAQLMAAVSANVPAIFLVTGPMMAGSWQGQRLGACTDCRRMWADHRAGQLNDDQLEQVEQALCSTGGTCMVMGSASTMACIVEAMGLMLPRGATAPAVSAERLRIAVATGRTAVGLKLTPQDILTPAAFHNALTVLAAIGGSTNAIIHLLAIARRAGVTLSLDDFHQASARVPLLIDCKPAGAGYLEDFHNAGGVPVLLKILEPLLDNPPPNNAPPPGDWQSTIHTLDKPLGPTGALAVIRGSLAPDGAVIKTAAASPQLMQHRGPAVVFESPEDAVARIDDPALGITADHVMVLRNAGPVGAAMPEAGSLPIPKYLAQQGVRDMVRVSDARMSGTAYGTVVLHCAPEAAVGGPLALVRNGDLIELNLADRRIDLLIIDAEFATRREQWTAPPLPQRGWERLYAQHVLPANMGGDLDFL